MNYANNSIDNISNSSYGNGVNSSVPDSILIKPEYSDQDVEHLLLAIRKSTTLFDYNDNESEWNNDAIEIVRQWIFDPEELMLIIFYDDDSITASLSFPIAHVYDFTYFIKKPNQIFAINDFSDQVWFGTIHEDIDGSLLRILEKIYAPLIFNTNLLNTSVKDQLSRGLNEFLSYLTGIHYKLAKITVLYVPTEAVSIGFDQAITNNELLNHLEAIALYWINSIQHCLSDNKQLVSADLMCPSDQYDFYVYRYEIFCSLQLQMQHIDFQRIVKILDKSQSIYTKQLDDLYEQILLEIEKINNNLSFLQLIIEPCEQFNKLKNPADCPMKLKEIIHLFRYIWINSKYFNTADQIISLFRCLSNQIIIFCRKKINLVTILCDGKTRQGIKMAHVAVDCCIAYKLIYEHLKQIHNSTPDWHLDESIIFNPIDTFLQRLKDLIEICNAMIVFGRIDELNEIPSPLFGGINGRGYEIICSKTETSFHIEFTRVKNEALNLIFDVNNYSWYNVLSKYRVMISDLEDTIENLMSHVFCYTNNVEERMEGLCGLYYYSGRKNLQSTYLNKVSDLWMEFNEEIKKTNKLLFDQTFQRPSWLPTFSGCAHILKINRMKRIKLMFEMAEWIPDINNSIKIFSAYEEMTTNVIKNIEELHFNWIDSIAVNITNTCLNRTLMCYSSSSSSKYHGMIECNIDRSVLSLCEEAYYFENLELDIPISVNSIYKKYDIIRLVYESVVCVALDYNRILGSISDREKVLFKEIIKKCEKKIKPGIYVITWRDDIINKYIEECVKSTIKLQEFIEIYKKCNLNIVILSEKMCNLLLINFGTDLSAKDITKLKFVTQTFQHKMKKKLVKYYNNICEMFLIVYEGFKPCIVNMADEWIEYVFRFDELILDSLRICSKIAMQNLYNILHGDTTMCPLPILKINIDINDKKICFTPTMSEIRIFFGSLANTLVIDSLTNLRRLVRKFNLPIGSLKQFSFIDLVKKDNDFKRLSELVTKEILENEKQIHDNIKKWLQYRSIWELDKNDFMLNCSAKNPIEFDKIIKFYTETTNHIQQLETITNIYFCELNSSKLKLTIIRNIDEWKEMCKDKLKDYAYEKVNVLYDYINNNAKLCQIVPENLIEMRKKLDYLAKVTLEIDDKRNGFFEIQEYFHCLEKHEVSVSTEMRQMCRNISNQWDWYLRQLKNAEQMLDDSKDNFKLNLYDESQEIKQNIIKFFDDLKMVPTDTNTSPKDGLAAVAKLRAEIQALYEKEARMLNDMATLDFSIPENLELRALDCELKALEEVWDLVNQWTESWFKYKLEYFWNIKIDEMEECAFELFGHFKSMAAQYKNKNWDILDKSKNEVEELRNTLPLLVALKNIAMLKRHWDRVRAVVLVEFNEHSNEFNLDSIIGMNFQKYTEQIMDISCAATAELQIENSLKTITETWETMTFEMISYRDGIYQIKNIDDCALNLEDNSVQIASMKSTRFIEPFIQVIDYWEKTLSYIAESLENSLIVQKQWLYLDNIFQGHDICRQMPEETKQFQTITVEWKEITWNMFVAKNAMEAIHFKPPNYLLSKLITLTEDLECIQRALEIFLETKRCLFPRFYFISNDEMLEILGNAQRPDLLQQNIRKLFDNINKVKLNKKVIKKTVKWEALGMISDDGEYVAFCEILILNGSSENWLNKLESIMRITLKELLNSTRKSLKKMNPDRLKWLTMWPGQLCLTCSKIQWTSSCTHNLTICKIVNSKLPLKKLRRKQTSLLVKLSEMSRRDLSKQIRLKVNTLITIEIHGRDVIDKMYTMNCISVDHFEWFSQLRFYWNHEISDCAIRQTNTCHWYLYEYTGNSGRLVITPLTDRCYMTLTTALHMFRGGSPKGPAGTGKTETVKDLGKALGLWVIVNNCSESLDYKSMAKCFSGLAQTGVWGCFDEFNRINIEVLSVVAQQINCILSALIEKKEKFQFEGHEICLKPTVGLFITMNPGYAGRTELPDNLKSMFRPISMMVPDSVIIAQNTLFSDGFLMAKLLAKKVNTLYELAIQQLSKQFHYDFGLRSMVALLRYAGQKRREFPSTESEERIVYLAMQDMNLAKLTLHDTPLFIGIMSDIFPGISIPNTDYGQFVACIKESLIELGMQPIPAAVNKVVQLYETKNSRHSVMILGNAGTAKSTTWKVLKDSFMRMACVEKSCWYPAIEYPINPKSLSLGELYGEFDLNSGEWLDGVLSAIMRKICNEETDEQKWLLFDGPVDAVWIESLNSVMDDNKLLTLVNSERITVPKQVSLLFEVDDLTVASPATISRCGMVYNDYNDWGWRPYMKSWLQKQPNNEYRELLENLLDRFMDKILNFKRLYCTETIPTNELNLIQSFCNLMNCLATKQNGIIENNLSQLEVMTKLWFMFCLIWSVCATVNEIGRTRIDSYIRELDAMFPLKGTIYDYYVNVDMQGLSLWEDTLSENWQYSADLPFYKIIVPTIDTVRYNLLVSKLLSNGYPVCLAGPVGTGKTSMAVSVLTQLDNKEYSMLIINMSSRSTSKSVQDTIESRTEKRTKSVYVPIGGKKMICFMDDFNMPAKDEYGSQCALEIIRQWIDYGFWYDRKKQWRIYVKQISLLAAMGPAGGSRQVISARTLSRFNIINMIVPSNIEIERIFSTMLNQKLSNFDSKELSELSKPITLATITLYSAIIKKMLPIPSKIHYLFNLRDISRIFQGLLRCNKECHKSKQSLLRLWIHESFRVFNDRLTDQQDCKWFTDQINAELGAHFELTFHYLCPSKECPIFGDFINEIYYEDLSDSNALRSFMDTALENYNMIPGMPRMDLVLFKYAVEHVTRIIRVISQPLGHMLLIGLGGSGRQSISRLAANICDYKIFQIEITKKYKSREFLEDLKKLYQNVGIDNRPTVFLFHDTQIVEENFMEILSNILSVGEVPNLYKPDEFEEIKNALEKAAKKAQIPITTEGVFNFFMERAKSNLHIILFMGLGGSKFSMRIRQYPALVNNATIDYFQNWPENALLEVANYYLSGSKLNVNITTLNNDKSESVLQAKKHKTLTEFADEKLRLNVATAFASIHTSASTISLQQNICITPTKYMELVMQFQKMLSNKRALISGNSNKLRNGLSIIEDTRIKVDILSKELVISKVQVDEFQAECNIFIEQINKETNIADITKENVNEQRAKISIEEKEIQIMADSANKDLEKAMPALNAATEALDTLNRNDLTEVKSYMNPPYKVEKVMEAVMILMGKKPTWVESKRQLGELNFLEHLKTFDKNHISDNILKRIAAYTENPELEPNKVGIVSLACKSLCCWVRAIERYGKIYKVVGPKIQLVEQYQAELRIKQQQLADAENKLAILEAQLKKLRDEFKEKSEIKEALRLRAEMLELNLKRAYMLVDGLADERLRWTETVKQLDIKFSTLPGDCVIATAFISYLGPFVSNCRDQLMEQWKAEIQTREIPMSMNFAISEFLADPTTIRNWNIHGLPSDDFNIENGIIVTQTSLRWPFIIDPQLQASKWIKSMERKNDLKITDFSERDFLKTIENALEFGKPLLIQNVLQELDPSILSILNKNFVNHGLKMMIKFNEKYIPYHDNFRLFITTKLSNLNYGPDISTRTTLVNFAVTKTGLEAQLLGNLVRKECPSIEEQKDSLVVNIAKKKQSLIDLENEILRMLNETSGSILENEDLFRTLKISQESSAFVIESLATAEVTKCEIDLIRESYRPCAKRAAILFFVLMDISKIDPMYQFSLDIYIRLFIHSIENSIKASILNDRINNLNKYLTFAVYKNTCRGLFEVHKLLFSFHMCTRILDDDGKLNREQYNFFLQGSVVLDRKQRAINPCPEWITDTCWDDVTELDKLPGFYGLTDSIEKHSKDWYNWFRLAEPEQQPLVGDWRDIKNNLEKMLFIRCFRPDRIGYCVRSFVISALGVAFTEPSVLDVKAAFDESSCRTPLVFILSPGVDPIGDLQRLANNMKMSKQLFILSLGQGQAPIATELFKTGAKKGHWIYLANCHLSLSWMPDLDKLVENLLINRPHANFRLWLSSDPSPQFPISILQACIKMTTEPPQGLKANLKKLYNDMSEETFNTQTTDKYRKLLFSLCFFHSILLERIKFQQLGFNVRYSFNQSDFCISDNLLAIYLDEYPNTSWDALKYLIADINYGGHVTDAWDRRLLTTYIGQYFNENVLNLVQYKLSSLSTYYVPRDGHLESYQSYINSLPTTDLPEAFGQHQNADISTLITESRNICSILLSIQEQMAPNSFVDSSTSDTVVGLVVSPEDKVKQLAADILSRIPNVIDYEKTSKLMGSIKVPLQVVLLQEIERYNVLLENIKLGLIELQKGIQGLIVMSSELEDVFNAINENSVPKVWLKAYSSLNSLGNWTRDLIERIEYFSHWAISCRAPVLFWLAAFTFPAGFLTAVLQTCAREQILPIDTLSWEFSVLSIELNKITESSQAENGVYIRGFHLEGAGWNNQEQCLCEPNPMELICTMPAIHFKPIERSRKKSSRLYQCPCYYYPIRSGSFVIAVDLKSGQQTPPDHWIKRSTAMLLTLSS